MLPKELTKENFIKILNDKKSDVDVYSFQKPQDEASKWLDAAPFEPFCSGYKIYVLNDSSVIALEKQVYGHNGFTRLYKFLDYFSSENVNKLIAKYAKKYGEAKVSQAVPYEIMADMLEEVK